MRTMAPGGMSKAPHFASPPRPRYDDGPHIDHYKESLLNSLKKRAQDRGDEMAEKDLTQMNRDRTAHGAQPLQGVRYVWTDDGRPSPRLPAADYIKAQGYDYDGNGKQKMWNPQKERYMDFTVENGITKPEHSDLNMSPEGKMRRQLMD